MVMEKKMAAGQARLQSEEVELKNSKETSIKHEQADLVVASESPCKGNKETCSKQQAKVQLQWMQEEKRAANGPKMTPQVEVLKLEMEAKESGEKAVSAESNRQLDTQQRIDAIADEQEQRRREAEGRHSDIELVSPSHADAFFPNIAGYDSNPNPKS